MFRGQFDLRGKCAGHAETGVVVPPCGGVATAVRGAVGTRAEAPGTAARHASRAVAAQPGATVRRGAFVSVVPAILDPLPNVAVRVVQAAHSTTVTSYFDRANGCAEDDDVEARIFNHVSTRFLQGELGVLAKRSLAPHQGYDRREDGSAFRLAGVSAQHRKCGHRRTAFSCRFKCIGGPLLLSGARSIALRDCSHFSYTLPHQNGIAGLLRERAHPAACSNERSEALSSAR